MTRRSKGHDDADSPALDLPTSAPPTHMALEPAFALPPVAVGAVLIVRVTTTNARRFLELITIPDASTVTVGATISGKNGLGLIMLGSRMFSHIGDFDPDEAQYDVLRGFPAYMQV